MSSHGSRIGVNDRYDALFQRRSKEKTEPKAFMSSVVSFRSLGSESRSTECID